MPSLWNNAQKNDICHKGFHFAKTLKNISNMTGERSRKSQYFRRKQAVLFNCSTCSTRTSLHQQNTCIWKFLNLQMPTPEYRNLQVYQNLQIIAQSKNCPEKLQCTWPHCSCDSLGSPLSLQNQQKTSQAKEPQV